MTSIELPFLDVRRDRHGRMAYVYFRRNGRLWPIEGTPGSAEWMADYQRLVAETAPRATPKAPTDRSEYRRGTFGALVNDFLSSGQFKEKKPRPRVSTSASPRRCKSATATNG